MKNLFLLLVLTVSTFAYSQEVTIVEELEKSITIGQYDGDKVHRITVYQKVGDVKIHKHEAQMFNGVQYFSLRYVFCFKDDHAVQFVEWRSKSNKSILTVNYIK